MNNPSARVLIVGAGPTGLFMACELLRYQIPFRIIDKKPAPTQSANAAGIQTRTLEMLADVGLLAPFLAQGTQITTICSRFTGNVMATAHLNHIDSIYPFILFLPQSRTEAILSQHLEASGVQIERNKTLTQLSQDEKGVTVTLQDISGQLETVTCAYVLGADGAHSTVRGLVGINFPGEDIEDQFLVADGVVTTNIPENELAIFTDPSQLLAMFPLGHQLYRMACTLDNNVARDQINEPLVKNIVHDRSRQLMTLDSLQHASPFWIHSKMAGAMRADRVFLAGDAAHIHSPLGGQGMNTGLQDVYNLAWKLNFVMHHHAPLTLLDTYERERKQVIRTIVNGTDKLTRIMLSTNRIIITLRNLMMRCVSKVTWLQKKALMRLTQLDIHYQGVGTRFRDVILQDGRHLHDFLDKQRFNVVIVGRDDANQKTAFETAFPNQLSVTVMNEPFYGSQTAGVYVVRPDMYVCYQGRTLSLHQLATCLSFSP